mmetsp:Transcript_15051/g.17036  ORF Transcript_15051/g.17036 Transcript_15051/m.17036 type:complete len:301 (-) Transcript_15051:115-1017(-)
MLKMKPMDKYTIPKNKNYYKPTLKRKREVKVTRQSRLRDCGKVVNLDTILGIKIALDEALVILRNDSALDSKKIPLPNNGKLNALVRKIKTKKEQSSEEREFSFHEKEFNTTDLDCITKTYNELGSSEEAEEGISVNEQRFSTRLRSRRRKHLQQENRSTGKQELLKLTVDEAIRIVFEKLSSTFISLETLEKTMIGKTVNKLSKFESISNEAKAGAVDLVNKWKSTAKKHRRIKEAQQHLKAEEKKRTKLNEQKVKMRKIFKSYPDDLTDMLSKERTPKVQRPVKLKKKQSIATMFQKQ